MSEQMCERISDGIGGHISGQMGGQRGRREGHVRRQLVLASALLAVATAVGAAEPAQPAPPAPNWPSKAVRFVVPSPAGTAPDIMARIVGDKLSRLWGQAVVVDNRPGAGGVLAFANMKLNDKDDHVFAFAPASSVALSPYMYKNAGVDIVRDLAPVAFVGESPMILAVKAGSPITSFAELVALMRRQPDTLVTAVPLQFSVPHLTSEMLSKAAGAPLRSVPYPGSSQGASAVVGGDAQVVIDGLPALDGLIQGGRLKALATFSATRMPAHPDWVAVAETFPDLVVNGWFGVFALAGVKPDVLQRVNTDVAKVTAMPDVVAKMAAMAIYPRSLSVPEFADYLAKERSRWEKALRDVGAKPQ